MLLATRGDHGLMVHVVVRAHGDPRAELNPSRSVAWPGNVKLQRREPFPAGIHGLVRNQYRHDACKQQTVPGFALGGVRASDASLLALPFLLLGLPTLSRNRPSPTEARYGEKYIVEHAWSHASLCKQPTRTCSGWARRQVAVGGRLQRWDSRKHRALATPGSSKACCAATS